MQIDEALKFMYANAHVKHRRLAYGEIVDACPDLFDMGCSPFVFAQAVLCVMGFPARMTFAVDRLGPPPEDQAYHLVEKLMSDELMPFTKSKMSLMSCPRRRSLYQELRGVAPSGREVGPSPHICHRTEISRLLRMGRPIKTFIPSGQSKIQRFSNR
jgi:hypothetical protein